MAGTMEDETDEQWDQNTISAYAEGFEYRMKGTGIQQPITDNPNTTGTPEATSWDVGWNAADKNLPPKPCVAAPNRVALA